MAKKAPAKKAPAERKPAKKAPVQPAVSPAKSSSPWRRSMLVGGVAAGLAVSFLGGVWSAGGWQIGPESQKNDLVSRVFDTQEAELRAAFGEQAVKLRAGEFATEKQAEAWMSERYQPKAEAAWMPLIEAHYAAYGGEQWNAEKQAATIERYAK